MAVGNNTPEGQGSEPSLGGIGNASNAARGRSGINVDTSQIRSLETALDSLGRTIDRVKGKWNSMSSGMRVALGASGIGGAGGIGGGGSRTNVPLANSPGSPASGASGSMGGAMRAMSGGAGGAGGGGGGGQVSNFFGSVAGMARQSVQPLVDLNAYTNQRIGQGAEYSLQADRMSVQLQQMYGMSNAQVRNQLRMPLTGHYLLGGGTAINDLLGMQASTGLTAASQASTVEAIRTVSGFSYGSGDVTRMLSSMASPDVANRMFMMGGTGMYGIGGKERTGMQTIQDIVRRTGLTNPEALKGALQQGSNTRQRLTAMGVPQDMQDMVIQYAMQNSEFQKKSGGGGAMYDPSLEGNRRTMGIEGSYAVQHEKTTGERIKREERFYGRQVDNFADFERNLRTATKVLAAFEDALSGIVGLKISTKGHPITNSIMYGAQHGMAMASQGMNVLGAAGDIAATAATMGAGGDPIDGLQASPRYATGGDASSDEGKKLSANNEAKLATLDPRLAGPLRKMLSDMPAIQIGDARRSTAQQERSFKARYTRRPDLKEKTKDADRIWNGEVWVYTQHAQEGPPMAPPGQSLHEQGLAADLSQSHNEWIRANASRYGLSHGGTTKGAETDEPFHVQPAGVQARTGGSKTSAGSASGTVRASSTRLNNRPSPAGSNSAPVQTVSSPNAGAMAAQYAKEMTSSNASILSVAKPSTGLAQLAMGGDPVDTMTGSTSNTGGMSITVSPTIYLNGGQNMSGDMRRIAKEVGDLLENEVKLRLMRRT